MRPSEAASLFLMLRCLRWQLCPLYPPHPPSPHRTGVACYSSKRGALGVCITSFILGVIMLVLTILAVTKGSIEIDTGWSSFEIKDL